MEMYGKSAPPFCLWEDPSVEEYKEKLERLVSLNDEASKDCAAGSGKKKEKYRQRKVFEKAVIFLLNKKISKAEIDKLPEDAAPYVLGCSRLKYINKKVTVCSTDLEFAERLFEQPDYTRSLWLRAGIVEGSTSFSDYNKCIYMLQKVSKWL